MLLRLSNPITLGLTKLIKQAGKVGGYPKHVELTSTEAFALLREINSNKGVRYHYSYEEGDPSYGISFRLSGKLNQVDLNDIASKWYQRKIGIRFDEIPLYVVVPRTKKKVSTKFRRNTKPIR